MTSVLFFLLGLVGWKIAFTEGCYPKMFQYMGVSKNRGGPPKYLVYNGKPY